MRIGNNQKRQKDRAKAEYFCLFSIIIDNLAFVVYNIINAYENIYPKPRRREETLCHSLQSSILR